MAVLIRWFCIIQILVLSLGVAQASSVAAEVKIITTEEPPTNYLDRQGVTGITTDVVREIQRRLNLNEEIELLPWSRAYQMALVQPGVVIFTAAKTAEREALGFHFIGPVVTRNHELWARSSSQHLIRSIDDIKSLGLTLGAMRDDWRAGFFKAQGIKVQEVPTHEQNLQMLLRGRFDLWVTSNIEAPFLIRQADIDETRLKRVFVFKSAPSYILLSKDTTAETVAEWQKAFSELQQSDYFDNLAHKWSSSLGYTLEYMPETGFQRK